MAAQNCKRLTKQGKSGEIRKKLADKPGSVGELGPLTVIPLGARLLTRSSNLPGSYASHVNASLLGLAPDGGCLVSPAATQLASAATRLCGPVHRLAASGC